MTSPLLGLSISNVFCTITKHVVCYLYFFHLQCSNDHVLRTLPKNLHLISMRNVLRLTTYMCIIPFFYYTILLNTQTTIDRQMTTDTKLTRHSRSGRHISLPTRYRAPSPTFAPHNCDADSLLSISDSPLTNSSHSDGHPEPKCVVCRLLSRRKAGLSCIKCHNYFHLTCIKPRIRLNTARMLPSWRSSDCLF